ncbi:capsid assembly scaffolding protein Gp46 family protein [Enterococcus sp. 22-H-5-01]|uniref:capsid assembly scaffolding protein Gp46 family protein n=1 Tax=Enterococcus sp. 22-H-5-01 TaxID=3418555 RepID=UPI003CFD37FB
MSEFKAIETQEELDRVIQDRLIREKSKYSDYDEIKKRNNELENEVGSYKSTVEELNEKSKLFDQEKSELSAKISDYETANLRTKIALQNGLPFDLAERLVGTDEKSLKADAERLAGYVVKPAQPVPPLKNTESPLGDEKSSAYKNLLSGLKNEGE